MIMDTSAKFVEDNGGKVILRVHDAMYVNKKINLKELHVLLQEQFVSNKLSWLGNKIISFEETFNQGYSYNDDDESDIDEAFSRLTGVYHVKPVIKLQIPKQQKVIEGYYGNQCYYEQLEYEDE
jgi:hypothetical protein